MKVFTLTLALIVILAWLPSSISRPVVAHNQDSQAPTRFSLRTLAPYLPSRIGYESLPVQVGTREEGSLVLVRSLGFSFRC